MGELRRIEKVYKGVCGDENDFWMKHYRDMCRKMLNEWLEYEAKRLKAIEQKWFRSGTLMMELQFRWYEGKLKDYENSSGALMLEDGMTRQLEGKGDDSEDTDSNT